MAASFILLRHTDDDSPIVIVIGSGTPLPNRPTSERLELPQELHEQLAQLHLEDARVYSAASLVGASDFSKRLQRQVKALASNNSDCLVIGPKGSGREHLARTIFNERNTDQVRLVPVHCAIADNELIQVSIKEWVFDQRASHTKDWLLLLNVDHMSIEAQSELWGYTQLPDFELRIIATAEQSLLTLAERGKYNASLAHFLSVQVIELLPLAQRKEDIPLLTQKFIESCNRESKHQVGGVDDDTNELLLEYDWPGNVDELQQTINHACEQSKRSTLEPGDLPDAFRHGISASRIGYHETEKIDLDEFLTEIERELIERAMRQTGNNRTKASDLLGISRARLIRRASALGIIKSSPKQSDKDQVVDESAFKPADED